MTTSRIVINSKTMMGKPIVKGTRITVEMLLRKLSQNLSPQEIIDEYPQLTEEDIKAALDYAASAIQGEDIYPIG